MMDFFVRESRAVVQGRMAIVRYGTCGGISTDALPGSIVVASGGSGYVTRNADAFARFYDSAVGKGGSDDTPRYCLSAVAPADAGLSEIVVAEMGKAVGKEVIIEGVDVTADSFYSSQGRKDANFTNENDKLIPL